MKMRVRITARFRLYTFCPILVVMCCLTGTSQEAQTGKLTFEPYKLRTFDGREHDVELGRLSVRENRGSRTNSRLIQLAFVRLRSTAQKSEPPIVFLAGGPGIPGIGMGQVPVYFSLFDKLRATADVILLDQRGTGLSSPSLQCPPPTTSAPSDILANEIKARQQYISALQTCTNQLRSQGIDVAAYTANAVADDVDDLRQALGVEKVSLIGMSYGTHLALAILRRYEAHVHRVVLAGTLGPDHAVHLPSATEMVILKISQLAAQDPNIGKVVPDFTLLVRKVLTEFERKPVTLTITDRRTNQPVNVTVGKVALQIALDGVSDGRIAPNLPALFYGTSRGDYSLLTRNVERLYNSLSGFGASAASVSLGCSSGWSAERLAKADQQGKTTLVGNVTGRRPEFCQAVGNPDLGPEFRAPIWSLIPTLFLSGTLDGNTPPYQAEEVRWGFPNGVHLLIGNAGHETLPTDEVQSIVVEFFKGQDVSGRNISLAPPRFRTPEGATVR